MTYVILIVCDAELLDFIYRNTSVGDQVNVFSSFFSMFRDSLAHFNSCRIRTGFAQLLHRRAVSAYL